MKGEIKRLAVHFLRRVGRMMGREINLEEAAAAQGFLWTSQLRLVTKINTLTDLEYSTFSQWGEDGIIEWIL